MQWKLSVMPITEQCSFFTLDIALSITILCTFYVRKLVSGTGMLITSIFCFVSADVYNIVSGRGSVGKFCLFKSAYRIGEEIVGSFDFSDSLIICLKVNIFVVLFIRLKGFYRLIVGNGQSPKPAIKSERN